MLLSFMPFSMLSHCSEIHFSFGLMIPVLMVRLKARYYSFVSGVEFFFTFLLVSQRSRMSVAIHGWIFSGDVSSSA